MKSGPVFNIVAATFLAVLFVPFANAVTATQRILHPVSTPYGIVSTNETATALYVTSNGTTKELFSSPGCGMYFTLSPDGSTVGFKDIFSDGMQAPALLNIPTGKITLLHSPVPQSGQVSFASDGEIAYSIGDDVFIRNGATTRQINIGVYSNIVSLSPDGSMIAYNDGHGRVHVMGTSSGQIRVVSREGCMMPLWSPAGDRLCYSTLGGKLYVFDAPDGNTYFLGDGVDPAWTADGTSLVVVRKQTQRDSLVNSDLYELSYDGKSVTRLTETANVCEADPNVGPDSSIVYSDYRSNEVYSATLGKSLKVNSVKAVADENAVPIVASRKELLPFGQPAAPSGATYFEVPYTNQVYDTPPGNGNLGSSACGPTSAIMVIAFYNLLPAWPFSVTVPTRHVSSFGEYVLETYHFGGQNFSGGGYGYMWDTGADPYHRMVAYYDFHGLKASELDAPSLDTVISEVTAGIPYTLCNGLTTAGHIIVINGVGAKKGTLVCNDPYGNKNSGLYPSYNGQNVQYDWPGYNNGNQNLNEAYWGVSVRYTPSVQPSDSIVDDLQFDDGFTMNNTPPASMSLWFDREAGYDGHEWYTSTHETDTCTAEWRPSLEKAGEYEISAYIYFNNPGDYYRIAPAARYQVHFDGDSATVVVNQSQFASGEWASLGTFPFAQGDSGYVELGDGTGRSGQIIIFDAMKWSYRSATLVQSNAPTVPTSTLLEQNYPNPFNPTTAINYRLSAVSHVSLKIYDVLGRVVTDLVDARQNPGSYTVTFDGSRLPSGVYFYRLDAGTYTATKKMVLTK